MLRRLATLALGGWRRRRRLLDLFLLVFLLVIVLALELLHGLLEASIHELVDVHAARVARAAQWLGAAASSAFGF